jgi:predicted enzyme related to lactoylglutathione lyase
MAKANAIRWFDIYVNDIARAVTLYENVLAQKIEPIDEPKGESQMIAFSADIGAYGAAGALVISARSKPGASCTMVYCSVENCAQEENRMTATGGHIIRLKLSNGPFGWVMLCGDTVGNVFCLNQMA